MYQVNTGRILMGYPSMGSWVTYGLGSESDNLPAYVVMPQPEGTPEGGTPCWGAGFLPAVYQGTVFRAGPAPILNLKPPDGMTPQRQRHTLDFLQKMNEMDTLDGDTEMAARISSYELAFRMQTAAPEAVDLAKEIGGHPEALRPRPEAHRRVRHALPAGAAPGRARRALRPALLRRRPVSMQWDAHKDLVGNHEKMCGMTDLPVAGLLKDLKQRGLLDSTLVIWGAEFGRLPMSQGGDGRDHNPHGFTMWFAGGGVKPGDGRRRDRRDGPARRRRALRHARLPRDHPAPARPRPESAVVPAQRPQREADRLRRQRSSKRCWRKPGDIARGMHSSVVAPGPHGSIAGTMSVSVSRYARNCSIVIVTFIRRSSDFVTRNPVAIFARIAGLSWIAPSAGRSYGKST